MSKRSGWWVGVCVALCLVGCSKTDPDRLQTFPIKGVVTYNGAPLVGADVSLVPVTPNPKLKIPPRAVTGKDGAFRVNTYQPDDGAPAGDYHILVSRNDEDPDSPGDAFQGRFTNPKKAPGKVTVNQQAEGEQEIPLLALTGPKVKLPGGSQ
jgi:hypothetical protein